MDPVSPKDVTPLEHHGFQLPSSLDSVAEIELLTEALAVRAGFDEDTASNIAMVTREAAINAVKHGNQFAPGKPVSVTLERTAARISICISDEGEGLDPETLPDPLDPANLMRSSGRGIFLMRAIMDEVHFRELKPGTQVTLVKNTDVEGETKHGHEDSTR